MTVHFEKVVNHIIGLQMKKILINKETQTTLSQMLLESRA